MNSLTEDEVEALRKLIPYAEQIEKDAEYRKSRRVVVSTWRQSIIVLATVITAVALVWNKLIEVLKWAVS